MPQVDAPPVAAPTTAPFDPRDMVQQLNADLEAAAGNVPSGVPQVGAPQVGAPQTASGPVSPQAAALAAQINNLDENGRDNDPTAVQRVELQQLQTAQAIRDEDARIAQAAQMKLQEYILPAAENHKIQVVMRRLSQASSNDLVVEVVKTTQDGKVIGHEFHNGEFARVLLGAATPGN